MNDTFRSFRRNAITILFLFACTALTLLIREQDRIITSQKMLIRQLFQDSLELHALRMREIQNRH